MNDHDFSRIVCVKDDVLIEDVVKIIVEKKISSVLVQDKNHLIVGIITERDIVRKVTLLDVKDKLSHTAATIMTRGVKFVSLDNLEEQIIDLHLKERIRHFPILDGLTPVEQNIVGMISITDFVRRYIADRRHQKDASQSQLVSEKEKPAIALGIIATFSNYEPYRKIFSQLGFKVFYIDDFNTFYNKQSQPSAQIIFDLDGFDQSSLKNLIPLVRKYRGRVIFATSQAQLIAPFRQGLDKTHQTISLKPIDVSYFSWFLTQ